MALVSRRLAGFCCRDGFRNLRLVRFASAPAEFLKRNDITMEHAIEGPYLSEFTDERLPRSLAPVLERRGIQSPTPIQAMTIPNLLEGRDVVGIAATGSGKTLAFAIPGLIRIAPLDPRTPSFVVLAPTRELAQQIADAIRSVTNEGVACVFGGAPRSGQERMLRSGTRIVVGTPGRMIDFVQSGVLQLDQIAYCVLDEADRMLDMGFEPQIRQLMSSMPPKRQTVLFSATWPTEVRHLASEIVQQPSYLKIGSADLHANPDIAQRFVTGLRGTTDKDRALEKILSEHPDSKTVVFVNTKSNADNLEHMLQASRKVLCVHGDKTQMQRDGVLQKMRHPGNQVLICTDIYARGMDIRDIEVVVNYDMPTNAESYVHRIGRTGRAGANGTSYALIDSAVQSSVLRDIVRVLSAQKVPVPEDLNNALQQSTPTSKFSSRRRNTYRSPGQALDNNWGSGSQGSWNSNRGDSRWDSDRGRGFGGQTNRWDSDRGRGFGGQTGRSDNSWDSGRSWGSGGNRQRGNSRSSNNWGQGMDDRRGGGEVDWGTGWEDEWDNDRGGGSRGGSRRADEW